MTKLFLTKYFNIVLLADDTLPFKERLKYIIDAVLTFAPVAFILEIFNLWFKDNREFFIGVIFLITINMILGGFMHSQKKTFNWEILFKKTGKIVLITFLVYIVVEIILFVAGKNMVTTTFETLLQVSTLLYPGGKILKNIFILSDGEHPPQWLMERIYNFQENGDLSELLNRKRAENDS